MIRVLHIITDTNIGGAGIWVLNSVGAMSEDFEVYVALPRSAQLKNRLKEIIEPSRLIEVDGIGDQSFSIEGYRALHRVIKTIKPNVVHTHASLAGRLAAKVSGKSAIINSRHCVEPISSGFKAWIKGWVNNRLSHRIIAVSEAIEQNLKDSGIKHSKIRVLSNGVEPIKLLDPQAIQKTKASYKIEEGQVVIGYIGRLEEVKGPLFIPEIGAELNQMTDVPYKIIIAGDGSQKEALSELIKEKQLEKVVQCIGLIDDVTAFYNSVDIVINTSRSEGIPMSLIEAMSVGLPIVAFNVGSLNQLVETGVNGYLIEPFDTKAYAEGLKHFLEHSSDREQFGIRSKEMMFQGFHVDQMNRQLEEIYREVIR